MNKLVFKSKDNEMIFHPGYLIKNIMDEEGKDTKGMVQLLVYILLFSLNLLQIVLSFHILIHEA